MSASDFDTCKLRSAKACAKLRSSGVDARWVQLAGFTGSAPDADPRWAALPPSAWQHYVVVADGTVIDHAARQFWPEADMPRRHPVEDLDACWDACYDITDALEVFLAGSA